MQVNVTETVYRNYQKITLQESPGSVQAGRLPRHREVVLLHDLIDCARPGEEIQVTGETQSIQWQPLVTAHAQQVKGQCTAPLDFFSSCSRFAMQGCTLIPTMRR